jgi:chromosomal replication initiation ATPase DnaA
MKEILNYIKLYTGCNEHALKRIEAMLEPRLQPVIVEKIVKVEKIVHRKLKPKVVIEKWAESYLAENGLTYKQMLDRSRKQEIVDLRYDFIKAAYFNGYNCTSIARFLKRDHSTIIYAINS